MPIDQCSFGVSHTSSAHSPSARTSSDGARRSGTSWSRPTTGRRAYRRMARRYHPDLAAADDGTTEAGRADQVSTEAGRADQVSTEAGSADQISMETVNAAWAVLRNPDLRHAYDASVGLRPTAS